MHGMLPDFMQCLLFALIQFLMMLFKIVFLFETTFIFSQHYLSREVCMVYSDVPLAKFLSLILHGRVHPSVAWCLELFI